MVVVCGQWSRAYGLCLSHAVSGLWSMSMSEFVDVQVDKDVEQDVYM